MWTLDSQTAVTRSRARTVEQALETADWVRRHLGIDPDRIQERALNSPGRRVLLNCSRQWGKSTITAAKAVHEASTNAGSLTLVVSPCARQSGEFMRKAATFTLKLGIR